MCTSVPEQQAYGVVPPASVASDEARRRLQVVKRFIERGDLRMIAELAIQASEDVE